MKLIKCNENRPLTPRQKAAVIKKAAFHYGQYMTALGFDWKNDDNGRDTPNRVAKAAVNELFAGCFNEGPKVTSFSNDSNEGGVGYAGMIIQTNIKIVSMCAHHHLPFVGVCHIGVIPAKDGQLIGLSKYNRIADHFARRPNLQEGLTKQIHDEVSRVCQGNRGVAVIIKAQHQCTSCRGIGHESDMFTSQLSGYFFDNSVGTRVEFFSLINQIR